MNDETAQLVDRARREMARQESGNRFLDLLEAGEVPAERLGWLAAELVRLVRSDQRSFALLASRFPAPPAGELFLGMAGGEAEALRLLGGFAAEVDLGERELAAYEPRALTQAYPAFLSQVALWGPACAAALALLANAAESGATYTRIADALRSRYGLTENAVAHFRFFAETPQDVLDLAGEVVAAGLARGEDPDEAVRVARTVHAMETTFWVAMTEGLG